MAMYEMEYQTFEYLRGTIDVVASSEKEAIVIAEALAENELVNEDEDWNVEDWEPIHGSAKIIIEEE